MSRLISLSLIVTSFFIATASHTETPVGTGFTYQGELQYNGAPVDGSVNFQFSLWDAPGSGVPPEGGNRIGAALRLTDIQVVEGVFTVILNANGEFGPNAWNGEARWLQMEVCDDPDCNSITFLSPRQRLTAAPFSLQTRGLVVDDLGRVGIGTATPQHQLRVSGGPTWTANGWAGAVELDNSGAIGWRHNDAGRSFGIGQSNGGLYFIQTSGDPGTATSPASYPMAISDDGFVGIGTTAPGKNLTIAGDAEVGTSHGDYRHVRIGGGNSSGFIYGSFPRFADGIHMGYNYYADAGGADRVIQPDGATSRITTGYGFAAIATGDIGQPPVDRVVVDSVGNVRLGANTQLYAPGGEENLRIVRGTLDADGGILAGTGFTTFTLGSGGQIRVNFNTPFAGLPTITSSPALGASSSQVFYTSPGQIELRTYSGGGDIVAAGVHFVAVGPR